MLAIIIDSISTFMYSKLLVVLLIGAGIYFTIRTKLPQMRLFKVLSISADALPIIAITHIQNTEPNPPIQIADDTPMIFPVPTRDAVDTINA